MDPSKAARVRKPRRTNSAPGSAFRAAHDRSIPSALRIALFGKRDAACHPMKYPTKTIVPATTGDADATATAAPTTLSVADLTTTHGTAADGSPLNGGKQPAAAMTPTILQDADMQDILDQMNESTTEGAGRESNSSGRASRNATEREGSPDGEGGNAARSGPTTSQPSSQPSDDDAEEGEFDVDEMRYLFNKLRETKGYCSDKVSNFVQHLWEELGQGDTGLMLLGRDAMAAPAAHVDRKRRLFGEKEPELHQRVLGVLNKVTDDKSKYREIKNELMRLPLPEANPSSLEQVVKCFFAKAVREQRFSSHYADLVEEICRIPPNQIQLGDKKESLSYRLRVALVCRCQEEFSHHRSMATLISEASNPSMTNDELEALRSAEKMKLCGNVKFVGELFLRKIVSARIIQLILVMLLCGVNNPAVLQEPLPPSYIPEADECDQLITLLMTTGAAFSKTDIGVQTLDPALRIVDYFSRHHPVQRTRFVLLDLLDAAARRFAKKVHGAPRTPATAAAPTMDHHHAPTSSHAPNRFGPPSSAPLAVSSHDAPPAKVGITIARRSVPPPVESTPQRTVPTSLSAETPPPTGPGGRPLPKGSTPASPMSQPSSTPKRSQPAAGAGMARTGSSGMIPAPRSASGMSPVTPRVNGSGDVTPQQRGASISPPPAYANLPKVPATVELIGPMMTTLVTSSDYAATAVEMASTFSSIRVAMDVWVQRSLGLIKAEKERAQIAPLMIALQDHGATREELRSTALQSLLRCVDAQLHDGGFRLWKYWAQVVAGDRKGVVLDDNLHNEAYSRVLDATLDSESKTVDKSIARAFIVDVLQVDVANGSICSARFTDVHASYTRFRPLNVLTNVCATLAKKQQQQQNPQQPLRGSAAATNPPVVAVLDIVACPAIVKLQDVELTTYLALLKGKPTRDELRDFFRAEKNMSNPYTPAKVLSAIYHAEYAGQARAFLDESLDLLMFVIDYANRNLRELALVLELYHSWKGITAFQRPMTEGQRWMSRLKLNAVVTDETHTRVHRLLESDGDAEIAIGPSKEVTHSGGQNHHHHHGSGHHHHQSSHGHHHSQHVRSIQH